jgi:hypothetical protein
LGEKSPNLPHNVHLFKLVDAYPVFKLLEVSGIDK